MMRNRKGQSILEYTLILGAVIAVVAAVILGGMQPRIRDAYDAAGDAIDNTVAELDHGIFSN